MIRKIVHRSVLTKQSRFIHQCSKLGNEHVQQSESENFETASRESRDRALKSLLENSTAFVDTKPQNELDRWATSPYADGTIISRQNRSELDIERPKIDPRDTSVILFPGDDAQFIGMAKSLECVPAAKDLFDYASEVLK